MSEEQLKAFLEAVKADEGLQVMLKATADANAVVEIAKAAGFAISADELKKSQAELDDDALIAVNGGYGGTLGMAKNGPITPNQDNPSLQNLRGTTHFG